MAITDCCNEPGSRPFSWRLSTAQYGILALQLPAAGYYHRQMESLRVPLVDPVNHHQTKHRLKVHIANVYTDGLYKYIDVDEVEKMA